MNKFTHPFDTIRTPEEVWQYLKNLLPEADGWESPWGQPAKNYVLAIAQHYAADSTPRPECSVANVVATISCKDREVVLEMLKTCPASTALVQPLIEACELRSDIQVSVALSALQRPLERINFGQTARHKVQVYLKQYAY